MEMEEACRRGPCEILSKLQVIILSKNEKRGGENLMGVIMHPRLVRERTVQA